MQVDRYFSSADPGIPLYANCWQPPWKSTNWLRPKQLSVYCRFVTGLAWDFRKNFSVGLWGSWLKTEDPWRQICQGDFAIIPTAIHHSISSPVCVPQNPRLGVGWLHSFMVTLRKFIAKKFLILVRLRVTSFTNCWCALPLSVPGFQLIFHLGPSAKIVPNFPVAFGCFYAGGKWNILVNRYRLMIVVGSIKSDPPQPIQNLKVADCTG